MPPKTIEEKYKKLSDREHILLRSGMYIGDTKKINEEMWVIDDTKKMTKKFVEYSQGFLKIFDEMLTNATDHATRDNTVTTIKVDYDKNSGEICVYNNGAGIPVVIHKEQKIYVPELIFGHLRTGSNYDDKDERVGAGTNGIGATICNIFSKKFIVETIDSENGLKYIQEFSENMTEKSKPKITKNSSKSYTKITFMPDYNRFQMEKLEDDATLLINKRVYDCIACTNSNVQIYLNGEKLKGKGLQDYAKYFFNDDEKFKQFYEINDHKTLVWEYIIIPWEKYEHVSFVNGNSTYQGGKHVDCIMNQIVNKIKTQLETKKKLKDVKAGMIKDKIFLFLRATVINPTFNSQTKECLTTQLKDFGCKIEVSDKLIDKIYKSTIVSEIVDLCKLKETIALSKTTDGVKKSNIFIPKLEDALWAGTAKSNQCTLLLTEGDSAKTFCMWGRSVVGIEKYGAFPLKGKILNVRDATIQQLINNEELNNIKKILGLKQGKEYLNTNDLRYGKVMLVTDADSDGSHIKSLFVNFIHAHYPSLIKLDFLQTLRTPIVKAYKGKSVLEFFTEQDYHKWESLTKNKNTYRIKYFKGLGTSQKDDAKEIFKKVTSLKMDYYYKNKKCDESILLAFDKDKNNTPKKLKENTDNNSEITEIIKCTDKRKDWLSTYDKNIYIDISENRVSYQDLINKELIHFSIYDNTRSIPSLCDGFKPSQRKIIHYMLKKNITNPIKVAQLSGYVSAETGYHHGEVSLQQAIVNLAQDFIGSNNINLLFPDGNMGSRLEGGKDSASPRYIFTYLSKITKIIFNEYDSFLLKEQYDDGIPIEPEWFIPVIPIILVNGCSGIGTGFSTNIPPHNPKDIIDNIYRLLDSKQPIDMIPYFNGFKGSVIQLESGSYISKGIYKKLSNTQIEITEIPAGTWVSNYKEFLESLIDGNNDNKKSQKVVLKDVKNKTLDENTGVHFIVDFKNSEDLDKLIKSDTLEKELKLTKPFSTRNMYLFDDKMLPSKYDNTVDILLDFYSIRLSFYVKRRLYIIKKLTDELIVLNNKLKFITEYINDILIINKQTKDSIIKQLIERKYHKIEDSFNYLINMPIISMTSEKIEELEKQIKSKEILLKEITEKTEKDLWRDDLELILKNME